MTQAAGCTRRHFLGASALSCIATPTLAKPSAGKQRGGDVSLEVGVTTSTFALQRRLDPKGFRVPDLLDVIRNELDIRVVDLSTMEIASFEAGYLDQVREKAAKLGCQLTNLKLNQSGLNLGSPDKAVREKALAEYKRGVDAAARLGMRWARPLPAKTHPDMAVYVAGYRELAEYAAKLDVQLLVENYSWLEDSPDSVVQLVDAIGVNVAACPDTGNWSSSEVRYAGLARTFPTAVSCDFKVRELGPNGQHEEYDLEKCFTIGWRAGFRGPWCLEHTHADRATLIRELRMLKGLLQKWIHQQQNS